MNLLRLSLSSLRFHALSSAFHVLILALGIALIVTLLQVGKQMERRFTGDLSGIDLVVGAKGSPIQLILSSVFHLDIPNGNIPLSEAEKLAKHPLIASAIPLALGDNYQGFRIVGTTPAYAAHYHAALADGVFWTQPMQAVLGSEAARIGKLAIGQRFAGSHGLVPGGEEHSAFPYTVTGILKPTGTVIDRLVLTSVESVWNIHEHHHHDADDHDDDDDAAPANGQPPERELTALLVTYKSPYAAVVLPRFVNKTSAMQAASPAFELSRLLGLLGFGSDAVVAFGAVLMVIAGIGFFLTLWNAVEEKRHDLALMRSLGATRAKLLGYVLTEGVLLGGFGAVSGLLLGHGFAYAMRLWVEHTKHVALSPVGVLPEEGTLLLAALGLSVAASILPALLAYRVDVAKTLSKGR